MALSWKSNSSPRKHMKAGTRVKVASPTRSNAGLLPVGHLAQRWGRRPRGPNGSAIEQALANVAVGLVEAGLRRLIVAGGETSGAVVDKLGLRALSVGPEISPGVPVLRADLQQPDEVRLQDAWSAQAAKGAFQRTFASHDGGMDRLADSIWGASIDGSKAPEDLADH